LLQSIPPHNGNDSSSESFPGQKEKRDQEPRLTTATIRHAQIRRIAPCRADKKCQPFGWFYPLNFHIFFSICSGIKSTIAMAQGFLMGGKIFICP